jgi:hypothetical protein
MLTLQSKLIALAVAVLIGVAAWGAHALEVSHLRTQIATLGRERPGRRSGRCAETRECRLCYASRFTERAN